MELSSRINKFESEKQKIILLKSLNKHKNKGIITKSLYNYLNSLLELEFSAISKKNNKGISKIDFELYRQIAIYNIFNRVQDLFMDDIKKLQVIKPDYSQSLSISLKNESADEFDFDNELDFPFFNFDFNPDLDKYYMFNSNNSDMKIGNIIISQYFYRKGQNEMNINALKNVISKLKQGSNDTYVGEVIDDSSSNNSLNYSTYNEDEYLKQCRYIELIKEREKMIEYYRNKSGLTDYEKQAIILSEKYYEKLLQEFSLAREEFELAKTTFNQKTLVLSRPNYNIINNINYIE